MDNLIYQDTRNGIGIKEEDGTTRELYFRTKDEVKESEFIQRHLEKYRSSDNGNFQRIVCLCDRENELYLSSKKQGKGAYFLSVFPHTADKHKEDCLFHTKSNEELCSTDGIYKKQIFEEVEFIDKWKDINEQEKKNEEKNSERKKTFNRFCRDLITQSSSFAFNMANKNAKSRSDLVYPSMESFLNAFFANIGSGTKLLAHSLYDSLPPEHYFIFGIIEEDIFNQVEKTESESDTNKTENGSKKINVLKFKRDFIDSEVNGVTKKIFNGYSYIKESYWVSKKIFNNTRSLVTNYSNAIKPPYFFMGINKVFNQDIKDKRYSKLIRFYVHPVCNMDYLKMCFVDSEYERKYAKRLFESDVAFIKPISNNCFYKVKGDFVNYQIGKFEQRAHLIYRPDFIEFSEDDIKIVEVSGYNDENYQALLDRKIIHYQDESRKSCGLYSYAVVNGKELE